MRVCLVSPFPPPVGGISIWSSTVEKYFESVENVDIVKVNIAPEWKRIYQTSFFIRIIGGVFQLFRDVVQFKKAIKGCNCCHLCTSGSLAILRDFVIVSICKSKNIPISYHLHYGRIPDIANKNNFEWWALKKVANKTSVVIVLDKRTKLVLLSVLTHDRIEQVPNPVEMIKTDFKNFQSTHKAIFIGWNLQSKGIEDLLAAWKYCNSENWILNILGPGDEQYRKTILEKWSFNNVVFLGEKPHTEALKILEESDFLVLPSHSEGFPLVILEAMMLGKPVIASDVGAIPEMIDNNNGSLVRPKDIKQLTQELNKMMSNEKNRKAMGENGRKKVELLYQTAVVMEKLHLIWDSILRKTVS